MIEVEIEADDWITEAPGVHDAVVRAAAAAIGSVKGDLVVLLTSDEAVRELNARFRDRDQPTNVLSFPAAESARPHLGDVVLAFGVCQAEAASHGKILTDHLSHLVVHGTLHLLGHDHKADADAEAMEAEEQAILASLGVQDPYMWGNGV